MLFLCNICGNVFDGDLYLDKISKEYSSSNLRLYSGAYLSIATHKCHCPECDNIITEKTLEIN